MNYAILQEIFKNKWEKKTARTLHKRRTCCSQT